MIADDNGARFRAPRCSSIKDTIRCGRVDDVFLRGALEEQDDGVGESTLRGCVLKHKKSQPSTVPWSWWNQSERSNAVDSDETMYSSWESLVP